jgi:hypothetical protein
MVSKEYVEHLKRRIREEVIKPILLDVVKPPAGVPPPHPLPPPILEDLRRAAHDPNPYRDKSAAHKAIDFILQNKRELERRDREELLDKFNVIIRIPPDNRLEDDFLAELKRVALEWAAKRRRILDSTYRSPGVLSPPDPRMYPLDLPPHVVFLIHSMFPEELKTVLTKHGVWSDPETKHKILELAQEFQRLPDHLTPEGWLRATLQKYPGYLDLLEASKKKKSGSLS